MAKKTGLAPKEPDASRPQQIANGKETNQTAGIVQCRGKGFFNFLG
ncbi:hypothetical protein [Thermoactinomyces sp. Gus2-1]|nr:hypothetical protein [Thermoactinomyces sp. Gus2-1]